jgi:hypothetical protein
MKIGIVGNDRESEQFSILGEALEDLGHEVLSFSGKSFASNLASHKVDAIFDATRNWNGRSKVLARLSDVLHIPLLGGEHCYLHLGYLLNIKNAESFGENPSTGY